MSVTLASAAGSLFARVYAGHTGVDPYTTAVSDAYQDVVRRGHLHRQGAVRRRRVPGRARGARARRTRCSRTTSSRGCYARAALVSDLELVDDYPVDRARARTPPAPLGARRLADPALAAALGAHARGLDAQPAASRSARFKILDNLRRSLVAPACSRCWPPPGPCCPAGRPAWTGAVLAVTGAPALVELLRALRGPRAHQTLASFLRGSWEETRTALARASLDVALLAYRAWEMVHAIVLTLVRLLITQRRLLEWETAAAASARACRPDGQAGPAAVLRSRWRPAR